MLKGPTAQDQIVFYAFYSATYVQRLCIIATWARLFKAGLKKPRVSARFEFGFENLKSISVLILSVYMLMFGSSKHNKENYPRKYFWTQEKETRIKFNPGLSANRPSNNWAPEVRIADSCGHPQLNNYLFRHVYLEMQCGQVFSALDCNPGSPEFRSHKKLLIARQRPYLY